MLPLHGAAAQDAQTATTAASDTPTRSVTLEQALRLVRERTALESREERERIQAFQQQRGQQQRLLNEARAERTRLQRESESLDQQFDDNEIRITQLEEQLNERQGNLKELFGVVKQNAGELDDRVEASLTSTQLKGRHEFLTALAQKRDVELPTIEELQQLWSIYLNEIVATGQIPKFTAEVVAGDGREEREVVRVGAFNLISDGEYLIYEPTSGSISVAGAQPTGGLTGVAASFQEATSGPAAFGVDPSGGTILGTYVFVPSLMERIEQGKLVGYIIIALGIFGVLLALWRWIALTMVGGKVNAQMKRETADTGNPLGRIMAVYDDNRDVDVETLELKLDEAILKEVPKIEVGLGIIKVISVVAPLLGLLGTVVGMIITFQAITLFGAGDPQIMADGISSALITTVLGLVVAIPMTLLYTVVASRAKRIVHVLEEQAAGIIAVHAEKRSGQAG